jgi:chromosome segregation ATPase
MESHAMSDNPVLTNAVKTINEAVATVLSEIGRQEGMLKSIPASTQQAQAHLAALQKERDGMVASLEKETAKLQATQAQAAITQQHISDLEAQAVRVNQRMVAAAQVEADKIVKGATDEAAKRLTVAQRDIDALKEKYNSLASQHAAMLTEIEKAAARLDAMKKTAREFAGA